MKRIITFFVLATMAISSLFAQDIIVTTDAKKIEAKILEVSKTEIKYKENSNLNGPTFVLETKEISSIIYSNGQVKVYTHETAQTTKVELENVAPTIDKSTAQILLLSGQTLTVQITDMKSNYVAYILDGKQYTMPASQIDKVTFLQNGQIKEYSGASNSSTSSSKEQNRRIYRDNGQYLYNDAYISSKEVEKILQRENNTAYKEWKKADGLLIGGSICAGIGGGLVLGGLFPLIYKNYRACIGMECAALIPLGLGLGLSLGSSAHYNKAIDIYNSKYDHAAVQLKWQVSANRVGLAFAF